MEIYSDQRDFSIYIVFNLINDNNYVNNLYMIQELFKERKLKATCMNLEAKQDYRQMKYSPEVVFRIPRPTLMTTEKLRIFFSKLLEIFEEADEFFPHFTQYSGRKRK